MKLYCAFRLDPVVHRMVEGAMDQIQPVAPLELVPRDRLHVTTLFIGERSLAEGSSILRAASKIPEFPCIIGRPSSFPGVLFLMVDCERATWVHDAQAHRLKELGGKVNTSFSYTPHLTLAKVEGLGMTDRKKIQPAISDAAAPIMDFHSGVFMVRSLVLMHQSQVLDEIQLQPDMKFT